MRLNLYKSTKIYVLSPSKSTSGGPELLHQLVHVLNKLGHNAFIYYQPNRIDVPEIFDRYIIPISQNIEDMPENILIVPEIYSDSAFLKKFHRIRIVQWWLGVHLFYVNKFFKSIISYPIRAFNKIGKLFKNTPFIDFVTSERFLKYIMKRSIKDDPFIKRVVLHLAQSYYAKQHLINKGIENVEYLSDYLNDDFITAFYNRNNKENIVIFNPRRGYPFIKHVISECNKRNIATIPIQNMTREEVIQQLQKAKVYIDFGNYSGKDRMPREAAILGCCVITGCRGSAGCYEDVPIPNEFKFLDTKKNIPEIVKKIKYCIENYLEASKAFDYYRNVIRGEKDKFMQGVNRIFTRI